MKCITGMLRRVSLLIGLSLGYFFYYRIQCYANTPLILTQEQYITLNRGAGRKTVAQLLQQQHLVKQHDARLFWLCLFEPSLAHFKAGTYRLLPGMTVRKLLTLLSNGQEAQFSLRFVEGSSFKQWLSLLNAAPYLQHTLQNKSIEEINTLLNIPYPLPEGWLFPETYHYTAGATDIALLKRAYQHMQKKLQCVWQQRDQTVPLKSPYELLILASIIEKESALAFERSKIASVLVNRLRRGMRLQADPTVIYGLGEDYKGSLTGQALKAHHNRYNTYVTNGLPPTPITMPGQDSLQAAAHPAQTPYLYFVANGEGGHTFSSDLPAHCQAVKRYRRLQAKGEQHHAAR